MPVCFHFKRLFHLYLPAGGTFPRVPREKLKKKNRCAFFLLCNKIDVWKLERDV